MALAARFGEVAAVLAPAPACAVQRAVSEFMREGLYLRHLRRMKRVYAQRRDAIMACLRGVAPAEAMAGLAVMLRLPDGAPDVEIAARAYEAGMAPVPLSPWYAGAGSRAAGLLLGVTNASEDDVAARCAALDGLIRGYM
jgi:GntR family transcriptional regulator/MocR family aminotransferase